MAPTSWSAWSDLRSLEGLWVRKKDKEREREIKREIKRERER